MNLPVNINERLIVALDTVTVDYAKEIVQKLKDKICFYKLGLSLIHSKNGLDLLNFLKDNNKRIFFDVKLHDINQQVYDAVMNICDLGVDFLTVHADKQVIKSAMQGKRENSNIKILAVTVLTNMNQKDIEQHGYNCSIEELVEKRIKIAIDENCDGIVCSANDIPVLTVKSNRRPIFVTPGIRLSGTPHDEQKRVCTPKKAMQNGSDYIVVGRPITYTDNSIFYVDKILKDMELGLSTKETD